MINYKTFFDKNALNYFRANNLLSLLHSIKNFKTGLLKHAVLFQGTGEGGDGTGTGGEGVDGDGDGDGGDGDGGDTVDPTEPTGGE